MAGPFAFPTLLSAFLNPSPGFITLWAFLITHHSAFHPGPTPHAPSMTGPLCSFS